MIVRAMAVAALLCGTGHALAGGDLRDEPLTSRIRIWRDSLLISTDTVARQATTAYENPSSPNPAAADWKREGAGGFNEFGMLLDKELFFDNEAWMTAEAAVGAWRLGEEGTFKLIYARLDTLDGGTRQNGEASIRSNEVLATYGQRLSEQRSFGATLHVTDSSMHIDDLFMPAGLPQSFDHDTLGIGFNLGLLEDWGDGVTFGLTGGVRWDSTDTEGVITFVGPITSQSDAVATNVRAGFGWDVSPEQRAYLDLEYVHFDDNTFGTTELGRLYVGTEQWLNPKTALRVGGVVDTEPQLGVSVGLGFYGLKGPPIEIAYSYNTLPELRHEFGRSHVLQFSMILLFQ